MWTLTVDPLCRVSCSPTAAGSTLNPDYTSETHENNTKNTKREVASFWTFFFQPPPPKKKKTQTAVRRSCRWKTLREVGESQRSHSQGRGGGAPRPHHKNHHRAAVCGVTARVDSVLDVLHPHPHPRNPEWDQCWGGGGVTFWRRGSDLGLKSVNLQTDLSSLRKPSAVSRKTRLQLLWRKQTPSSV